MKTNKTMRIASALLIAVILTTCAISGTFAKYTSTKNAVDSARVAKWSFTVGGTDIATKDFTFDLFNTVKDTDGAAETDVAVKEGETIIAPGTSGSFDIVLANASEVNAKYSIVFEETANTAELPILYRVHGGSWNEIATFNLSDVSIAMNATTTVTVEWKWDFEQDATNPAAGDELDTADGIAAAASDKVELSVKATITATQVD